MNIVVFNLLVIILLPALNLFEGGRLSENYSHVG